VTETTRLASGSATKMLRGRRLKSQWIWCFNVGIPAFPLIAAVDRYPTAYSILLFSDDSLSRRAEKALTRFNDIYEMRIPELIARVLAALQGDEDADGGQLLEDDSEQEEVPDLDEESEDSKVESFHLRPETIGKLDWSDLKT